MKENGSGGNLKPGNGEPLNSIPLFRKKRVLIPALAGALVLLIGFIFWYFEYFGFTSTDDAYIDGYRFTISSKYTGRISELAVDEGDRVTKGQVLAKLDDSDLRAQEKQAFADVEFAKQSCTLSTVNFEKASDDYKRAQIQFKNSVISKEQFDHAKKGLEAAQAQNAISLAKLESQKAMLGVIQTQLQNIIIVSPVDGVAAKRWAIAGDVVQMAQPILSVYDLKNIWVTANFEETKYSSLKLNQKVFVTVDAYDGKEYEGKVIQLGSNTAAQFSLIPPNNASGNFTKITQRIPVKISIESLSSGNNPPDRPLLPGMSVEVKVKSR
jgi:membrane fusion protein, multidrug efflux system